MLLIEKKSFHPVLIRYFEKLDMPAEKELTLSEIRDVQGTPTAHKMVMKNLVDHTETVMQLLEVDYNREIDPNLFTERGMKK